MNVGDTYFIPQESGIVHPGHTATVTAVVFNHGDPPVVHVKCSCGKDWEWEDRYPSNCE